MSYQDDFVNAVERIEPDGNLRKQVLSLTEQSAKPRKKPVLKYAVSFVLTAAVLAGGVLCWPMQPVRKDMGSISVAAPQNGFTVVVNAAVKGDNSQAELKPGHEFQIADETDGTNEIGAGGHSAGKKDEEMVIAGFRLKCVGSDIEKVTYQTNRGEFQRLVRLNAFQKAYRDTFRQLPDADLKWATPDSAYSPAGTIQETGTDFDGMLYLKETATINMSSEQIEYNLKYTSKIEKILFDGTEITIDVLFKNGIQSKKTVRLTYPDQQPGTPGSYITATLLN